MLSVTAHTKVYIAREPVDMRRQMDGLALEVQEVLQLDPLSAHVFVFRNRSADRLKGLYWDGNGFVLFYKRIERGRFQWPSMADASVELGVRELSWLLEGHALSSLMPRKTVRVAAV